MVIIPKGPNNCSKMKSYICYTSISRPSVESLAKDIIKVLHSGQKGIPSQGWWKCRLPKIRTCRLCGKLISDSTIESAGLFVNPFYPWLDASPTRILSCTGQLWKGCDGDQISIQHKRQSAAPLVTANFYLKRSEEDVKLSRINACCYQIQGQLAICYRDFICWTTRYTHTCVYHIKWIAIRDVALWDELQPKLNLFYVKVIFLQIIYPNSTSMGAALHSKAKSFPLLACTLVCR